MHVKHKLLASSLCWRGVWGAPMAGETHLPFHARTLSSQHSPRHIVDNQRSVTGAYSFEVLVHPLWRYLAHLAWKSLVWPGEGFAGVLARLPQEGGRGCRFERLR